MIGIHPEITGPRESILRSTIFPSIYATWFYKACLRPASYNGFPAVCFAHGLVEVPRPEFSWIDRCWVKRDHRGTRVAEQDLFPTGQKFYVNETVADENGL
jgi:hypothetical protein